MKANLIIAIFVILLIFFATYVAVEDISEDDNVNQQQLDLQRAAIAQQQVQNVSATPNDALLPVQVEIAIKNGKFQPQTVTIQKGTTVIWQNLDIEIHYVHGQQLGSSPMRQGDRYFHTFNQTGSFIYNSGEAVNSGQVTVIE